MDIVNVVNIVLRHCYIPLPLSLFLLCHSKNRKIPLGFSSCSVLFVSFAFAIAIQKKYLPFDKRIESDKFIFLYSDTQSWLLFFIFLSIFCFVKRYTHSDPFLGEEKNSFYFFTLHGGIKE